MTEGTQPQEVFEKAQESQEVSEARQSLDKATIEPAAEIQSREELTIPDAENLEKEVKAAVDAIPEAAEVKPAEITLEAAVEEGTVTIDVVEPAADRGPGTEDGKDLTGRQGDLGTGREMDPVPVDVGEGKSTDLPAGSGADTVMIDTVPLPESPAGEAEADGGPETGDGELIIDSNDMPDPEVIIDSNDGTGRESIGTWPTPDSPEAIIDSIDGTSRDADQREVIGTWPTPETPAVIEGEESVQEITDPEIVSQLMDQLPESAAGFTDQAAAEIVELALADSGADFVSPIRSAIQDQYQGISATQADGLLAASLLKAAESMGTEDLPDQPPDAGPDGMINPNYPGTDPAGGEGPGIDPAGNDGVMAEDHTELEENNLSEISAENTDLAAQTELNALESELSAVEQDLGGFAAKVEATNNVMSAVREEISLLRDELDSWPDDVSTREITYSEWVRNPDGSYSEVQSTKTMTKAEVQNLLNKMETLLETMGDMNQMDMLKLQDAMNAQAQLMQMMSNVQKMMNDTAMAIIRNMK